MINWIFVYLTDYFFHNINEYKDMAVHDETAQSKRSEVVILHDSLCSFNSSILPIINQSVSYSFDDNFQNPELEFTSKFLNDEECKNIIMSLGSKTIQSYLHNIHARGKYLI